MPPPHPPPPPPDLRGFDYIKEAIISSYQGAIGV